MELSKKALTILLLAALFLVLFFAVFSAIALTQSVHSIPGHAVVLVNGMDITVGPQPNATNVSLDTAITVDALASASLSDLRLTPEVLITRVSSVTTGPLTYQTTFFPDERLKTSTTYTVSVTIVNAPTSWNFTTTAEPFKPTISFILATNAAWISLATATLATSITAFAVWFRQKRRKQT
jgi:hypothetical protein